MRCAAALLIAVQLAAATTQADQEKMIRDRADQFYKLLVARKFRESEPFVNPSDRDDYYAMQKPLIYDFTIKSVAIDAAHKTAILEMESTTKVQRAIVGQMTIPLSYQSFWKDIDGTWFWYIPDQEVRDTPFGKMVFTKKDAVLQNKEDLKDKLSPGPTMTAVLSGVKAEKNVLTLGANVGDSASLTLTNLLPGHVHLVAPTSTNPLFTAKIVPEDLAQGGKAALIVKRADRGPISATTIFVKVEPTQQQIAVRVQ